MSSDEAGHASPVLPNDSDRGSSVSSVLQDEYEELLRYAVVTPRYEPHVQSRGDVIENERRAAAQNEPIIANMAPQLRGSRPPSQISAGATPGRCGAASDRTHMGSDRSERNSPDPVITEIFIPEENLNKVEDILDTWSNNLKVKIHRTRSLLEKNRDSNVMMELRKWKLAFVEQHRLEMMKEREKHAAHLTGIHAEMDSLKDLLNTFQISNQRKDEVIVNLTRALDRQRERLELMKSFTHWRLQNSAAKEEMQASRLAEQHYQLQLKKRAWASWLSLIQRGWKDKAERACRARAEEVCTHLTADYQAKLAEHAEALQKAQAEIQQLHRERERYEDSMKKAFMRGVCALNIEALSMFNTGDPGRPGRAESPLLDEQPTSSSMTNRPFRTASSARLSPISMDSPVQPAHSYSNKEDTEADQLTFQTGYSTAGGRSDPPAPTTLVNTDSGPGYSILPSFRPQTGARTITAGQQKASKTVTARITGRSEAARASRNTSNLNVMGVAPPMSSVIVERHHPVTQCTIGQATAARFPRSALQSHTVSTTKSSSQAKGPSSSSSFNLHSIKVVD